MLPGLKKKLDSDDVIRRIGELAFGKANDTVKLALIESGERADIDALDLSLLSEVKRSSNGVVEVKILNRLYALELLAKLLDASEKQMPQEDNFFKALDAAASKLSDAGERG